MSMRRFISFLIPFLTLTFPMPMLALTLLPACADSGNCYTCDFLVLFVNWSQLILYGLTGFAVLMIAIAGFLWIISAGRAEMVQKGRQIITGTIIGIAFAFLGYLIVNFTIAALLGASFDDVQLFGTDWATFCESGLTPGGATTDCAAEGVADGASCANSSCSDEGVCVCLNDSCVTKCVYTVEKANEADESTTYTGSCVDTTDDCTALGGASDPGFCLSGQVCCITE